MQNKTITFMKKFMFTAIAMVAFVGTSMANTIEIEDKIETLEVEITENGNKETAILDACSDCYAYADSRDDGNDRQLVKWKQDMNDCWDASSCDNIRFDTKKVDESLVKPQ